MGTETERGGVERMSVAFRELGISHEVGSYIWCLHCEQVFLAETVKRKKETRGIYKGYTFYLCPNNGCNGSAIDFFPWEHFRDDCTENQYPEVPVLGTQYSMYPFKK